MEGALTFITSDDPQARSLRDQVVFVFTPMLDPDGCATGQVRFNANGYDLNRHWDEVDLRQQGASSSGCRKSGTRRRRSWTSSIPAAPIDLMLNLHNTETTEYLETQAQQSAYAERDEPLLR